LGGRGSAAAASTCVGPGPDAKQQGLGCHDESAPTLIREQASERAEEGAIRGPQRRTVRLAGKHYELMPQHEQLDVLDELAAPAPDKQPQNSREREISEGKKHPPMLRESSQPPLRYPEPRF